MSPREWQHQDPIKELERLALIYFQRGHSDKARQLLEEISRIKKRHSDLISEKSEDDWNEGKKERRL